LPCGRGAGGHVAGVGMQRDRSGIRFEESPAITPSWKSNSWNLRQDRGTRAPGERSPDLKPATDELLDQDLTENEKQLDRDWYDRWELDRSNAWSTHVNSTVLIDGGMGTMAVYDQSPDDSTNRQTISWV
jgi:hypothetical protein